MYGADTQTIYRRAGKGIIQGICQGILDRPAVQETLGIGKARFFALLKQYRHNPEGFSLTYQRTAPARLPARAEEEIVSELMLEKGLIDDPTYFEQPSYQGGAGD
jgi:hypothetical protein